MSGQLVIVDAPTADDLAAGKRRRQLVEGNWPAIAACADACQELIAKATCAITDDGKDRSAVAMSIAAAVAVAVGARAGAVDAIGMIATLMDQMVAK